MLHQVITAICGLTLQAQVNACRITLQQATIDYNAKLNAKAEKLKAEVEPYLRNDYYASLFLIGKVAYEREININYGRFNVNVRSNRSLITWKWEY